MPRPSINHITTPSSMSDWPGSPFMICITSTVHIDHPNGKRNYCFLAVFLSSFQGSQELQFGVLMLAQDLAHTVWHSITLSMWCPGTGTALSWAHMSKLTMPHQYYIKISRSKLRASVFQEIFQSQCPETNDQCVGSGFIRILYVTRDSLIWLNKSEMCVSAKCDWLWWKSTLLSTVQAKVSKG